MLVSPPKAKVSCHWFRLNIGQLLRQMCFSLSVLFSSKCHGFPLFQMNFPITRCQRSVEQSELLLGDGKNFIGRDWCHDSEIQPHTHPHTLILIQLSVAESYDCPKCNVYYRLTPGDIEWEGKLNNSRGKELGPGNAKDYQYLLFQGPE